MGLVLDAIKSIGSSATTTIFEKINDAGKNIAATVGQGLIDAGADWLGSNTPTVLSSLVGFDITGLGNLLETVNNQPSVAYVPIQAEICEMHRQCDVGNTMLISQTNQNKDYYSDNVAPRPRTWTIKGYISSLNPIIENGLMIKPTIKMQIEVLNAASESRQAVKFKTEDGDVLDVFVQDLRISSNSKSGNAKEVTIVVQELKVLAGSESLISSYDLSSTGAASVITNAFVNMGNVSSVVSGVVSTVGSLLGSLF